MIEKVSITFEIALKTNIRDLGLFRYFVNPHSIRSLFWYSAIQSLQELTANKTADSTHSSVKDLFERFHWNNRPEVSLDSAESVFLVLERLPLEHASKQAVRASSVVELEREVGASLNESHTRISKDKESSERAYIHASPVENTAVEKQHVARTVVQVRQPASSDTVSETILPSTTLEPDDEVAPADAKARQNTDDVNENKRELRRDVRRLSDVPCRRSERIQTRQSISSQENEHKTVLCDFTRAASRKRTSSKDIHVNLQPPRKQPTAGRAYNGTPKSNCALKCLKLADDILENVQLGLASPHESQALASLPQSSTCDDEWAIFFSSFDDCFSFPISSNLKQIREAEITIGAIFMVSSKVLPIPPTRIDNTDLKLVSQTLFMSPSWNYSLREVQAGCVGHCLAYSRETSPGLGPEFECIRVHESNNTDFWPPRVYLDSALKNLEPRRMGGILDLLAEQTDLLEVYTPYRSKIAKYFKVVDYYFDGRKSKAESCLNVLRRWVLNHCTCGGHALLCKENEDQYNTHPQKGQCSSQCHTPISHEDTRKRFVRAIQALPALRYLPQLFEGHFGLDL